MRKLGSVSVLVLVGVLCSTAARATTIIDNTTLGFYNAGLGDLANNSVLGAQTDLATGFHLFPAANVSAGDPLIPPVASEPNLLGAGAVTQAALGGFLSNTLPLGGSWSSGLQAIPLAWAVNSETAIVYPISADSGLNNVSVSIGVDNGVFVWLNGVYKFGALAPGGATPGEYSFNLGSLTGTNYLQILREDHGGATGWDIAVSAETAAVPEPQIRGMLISGLLALALGTLHLKTHRPKNMADARL